MLRLSLSCGTYDRTLPLLDGRVKPEGVEIEIVPTLRPQSPMGSPEADLYEASVTRTLMRGGPQSSHIPIAVFPRRKFTHQLLLKRKDSAIRDFPDFSGKRVGVLRWYEHPLGVWLRGLLSDRYGIQPRDIHWFTEAQEFPLERLEGVKITLVPKEKSLIQMLLDGELDVVAHEDAHRLLAQHADLQRVFPRFKEVEAEHFQDSGIFPSYHVLVLRREIAERHRWLVENLIKAFEEAKEIALQALEKDTSLFGAPWMASLLEEQWRTLRRDLYPYGIERNRGELETLVRYLCEQGLSPAISPLAEIFAM